MDGRTGGERRGTALWIKRMRRRRTGIKKKSAGSGHGGNGEEEEGNEVEGKRRKD